MICILDPYGLLTAGTSPLHGSKITMHLYTIRTYWNIMIYYGFSRWNRKPELQLYRVIYAHTTRPEPTLFHLDLSPRWFTSRIPQLPLNQVDGGERVMKVGERLDIQTYIQIWFSTHFRSISTKPS